MSDRAIQCKSCPWRVGASPERDISGYSKKLHESLACTIAQPGEINIGEMRMMACHHSKPGAETPCAGWLAHQLGIGNNIGLRLRVISGHMPAPVVDGEQHERFEDTLPRRSRSRVKRR
jgi:hypothetical protein